MLSIPQTDTVGDKLIKIIIDSFPDGLNLDEAQGLVNVLYEHRVSILKDIISKKEIKLGLTMNMIAQVAAFLADRYLEQRNELPIEGVTRDNFLHKFSEDFKLVQSLKDKLLENPFIEKIEPYGSGVFNLTDVEFKN